MDHPVPLNQPLPPEAITALRMGRKIDAIKILREVQSLGLKDAKERVDQYVANDPILREQLAAKPPWSQRGCLLIGMGLVALIGIGFFIFFRG